MQRILEYVRKISMPEGELISDIVRHAQSPGFRSDDLAEIAEAVEEMTLLTRDTHFEHVDGLARQS
ncbi:MAG: hypothetical protein SF123_08500 [Chloroflexota bacterium]|nr:hypothetical protein [Chloroflexota bacterium]